jgi:hypothetical protein
MLKSEVEARRSAKRKARIKAQGELETLGKEIAVRLEKIEKAKKIISDVVAPEIKSVIDHTDSVEKLLAEAQKKCKVAGMKFAEFHKQYAPNYSRSKVYELCAIGRGALCITDQRERKKIQKREERAVQKVSTTTPVVDTSGAGAVRLGNGQSVDVGGFGPAAQAQLAEHTGSAATEISTDAAKARMAALAGEAPPTAPTLTAEEISDEALAAFTRCCQENGPKWTEADEKKARVYFNQREYLPRSQRKIAA